LGVEGKKQKYNFLKGERERKVPLSVLRNIGWTGRSRLTSGQSLSDLSRRRGKGEYPEKLVLFLHWQRALLRVTRTEKSRNQERCVAWGRRRGLFEIAGKGGGRQEDFKT